MKKPKIALYGCAVDFQNYAAALTSAGFLPAFLGDGGDSGTCDGLLLAGGGDLDPALYGQEPQGSEPPDRERDAIELQLLSDFTAAAKPVFGICRGLQMINVFFGGTLLQDIPGHSRKQGRDRLHPVQNLPGGSTLADCFSGPGCIVNSSHHQAVDRTGSGLQAVQVSEGDDILEALVHETLPVFAVQYHPERLTGAFRRAETPDGIVLFRFFQTLF